MAGMTAAAGRPPSLRLAAFCLTASVVLIHICGTKAAVTSTAGPLLGTAARADNVSDAGNPHLASPQATADSVTRAESVHDVGPTPALSTVAPSSGSGPPRSILTQNAAIEPKPLENVVIRQQLLVLYKMTNTFLGDMVQPRYLTDISDLLDFNHISDIPEKLSSNWQRLANYFIGYLICAAVGIVLLIFVPLIGACVGCCRCCGNCGGKTPPQQGKYANSARCCCGFFLFVFVSFALAGGILMIVASIDLQKKLSSDESLFDDVAANLNGLSVYTDSTMDEVETATLGRYQQVSQSIFSQLESIVTTLDKETNASTHIDSLTKFSDSLPGLNASLHSVDDSSKTYEVERLALSKELDQIKANVILLLQSCISDACTGAKDAVAALATEAKFDTLQVGPAMNVISVAIQAGLSDAITAGAQSYTDTIQKANESLEVEIDKVRSSSAEVEEGIDDHIKTARNTINGTIIRELSTDILHAKKEAVDSQYIYIPFWVFLIPAVLILLVVLSLYTGLLCGVACKRAEQGKGSCCTKKSGACWLITGLVILFLFFLVLMLILVALFLGGGLSQTEVCRHMRDLPNSQIKGEINDAVNALVHEAADVVQSYEDCARNKSLYEAVNLEAFGINITAVLDVSELIDEIDQIKDVQVDLPTVTIISGDLEDELTIVDGVLQTVSQDVPGWIDESRKNVTTGDVSAVAATLDSVSNDSSDPTLMQEYADQLRNLSWEVRDLDQEKISLATALKTTSNYIRDLSLNKTVAELKDAQEMINTRGSDIISTTAEKTAEGVADTVTMAVSDIETDVKENIGHCFPLYSAASNVIDSICVQTLYSINAYWFALGMSLIFLLPAIICAFKLVGLYRHTQAYVKPTENNQYMSAYDNPDYQAYANQNIDNETLLNKSPVPNPDYMGSADNPVYMDDERPCVIPRAVLRFGQPIVPMQPAAPDNAYFYAMPARRRLPSGDPPKYTKKISTTNV